MPSLHEETVVAAPLDQVWRMLRDPEIVASCIPGAELDAAGDAWKGSIKVKFGPTLVTFRGEAGLTFDDATRTCAIKGRGIDQRGASRALASGKVALAGEAETTLTVDGEFNVTGPLEAFANAGGVHVARALLAEFSTNLAAAASQAGAAAPESEPETAPEPAPEAADAPSAPSPAPAAATAAPEAPAPAPKPAPASRPAAGELNAFALIWSIIKSKAATLLGKKG